MKKKQTASKRLRRGLTLLELIIATTMLTMVMTSVGVILRSSRQAWEAHAADYERIEAAHGTLRHIVRRVRQARGVSAITPETEVSGRLDLLMPDDSVEVWEHDEVANQVNYGVTTASNLLAPQISELRVIGYAADGTTVTTVVDQIRALQIEVTVELPVEAGGTRSISSWAWIRSW